MAMARVYTAIVNEQFRTNDGPDTRSNKYTVVRFFTTFSPPPHEKWHAMRAEAGRCDQPQTRRLVQKSTIWATPASRAIVIRVPTLVPSIRKAGVSLAT